MGKGKESTLVKIVLRHLRPTEYSACVKSLVGDIKLKMDVKASIPVWNEETGEYAVPERTGQNTEDWDYRNYHEDWLPKWADLKSKLVSEYKEKHFQNPGASKGKQGHHDGKQLPTMYMPGTCYNGNSYHPTMFMPGAGINPKIQCFGCGAFGHRKGDPGCTAGPDDWHDSCPPKFLEKVQKMKKRGVDGFTNQKGGDGICFSFRDTGKCKFGPKCKFKHVKGGQEGNKNKRIKLAALSKEDKKVLKVDIIKQMKAKLKKKAKKDKDVDYDDLQTYLTSIMYVRTIPRELNEKLEVVVSEMAASELLDTDMSVCHDTGAAAGISVKRADFVWLDDSVKAKSSVNIKGPSVGSPGCLGRGPLVYRCDDESSGKQYGVIEPEGVLASSEMKFRVSSAQIQKARGLRIIGGEFEQPDFLECVRTKEKVQMMTMDNIMCLKTKGDASEIVDSPEFRKVVEDIRLEKRSPLVDLTPFLPGGKGEVGGEEKANMHARSFLTKLLMLTTVIMAVQASCMVFNEARAEPVERARLWVRRLAYIDSARLRVMANMPEYGDFPNLPRLNEDNVVGDQAKFSRDPFKPNDPCVTMDCPPWWRVYVDGYGGQNSLGGESYEGAVGSYIFVCCSTGSTDVRLYASHEQFPVALHQFFRMVESEHFKVQIIHCDTHSVNISADAEEVVAVYGATIVPVSAGTPQEMAFAESMVRVIKRMSTAMLAGAPHLPKDAWACSDKYAVFIHDFLPQSTRGGHCPYYLRTGRKVNWKVLPIHVFGAPLCYAPMDGPIHKRAPIAEQGHFYGVQWPAVLVRRVHDGKILNCARQKIRVYEKAYLADLDQHVECVEDVSLADAGMESERSMETNESSSVMGESEGGESKALRPELSKNMVQSAKSIREYRFKIPGKRQGEESKLENSASIVGDDLQTGGEGLYIDEICNQAEFESLTEQLDSAIEAAKKGLAKKSIRENVLSKLNSCIELAKHGSVAKGQLKVGKRKSKSSVSKDNVVKGKRARKKVTFESEAATDVEKDKSPVTVSTTASNPKVASTSKGTKPNSLSSTSKKKGSTKKNKGGPKIKVGDVVSLPATAFDGEVPGSYSDEHPEPSYGEVLSISDSGLVKVKWMKDDHDDDWVTDGVGEVRLRDLSLEVRRRTISNIIVFLVEGEQVAFEHLDKNNWPKNFFELLVKQDWRKWVASVKKELEGWDENNAVTVVNITDVPRNAKVVPLGELYSRKRDGRYKFRQYLMGNLLREGVDFAETFSTNVSSSGLCTFYSISWLY